MNDQLEDIAVFEEVHSLGEICAKLDVLMERKDGGREEDED